MVDTTTPKSKPCHANHCLYKMNDNRMQMYLIERGAPVKVVEDPVVP